MLSGRRYLSASVVPSNLSKYCQYPLDHSAIMVTGGYDRDIDNIGKTSELLHYDGTFWCALPEMKFSRRMFPLIGATACGGGQTYSDSQTTCFTLGDNGWTKSTQLKNVRNGHAAWTRPDGKIQLMGGESYNTSEVITKGKARSESSYSLKHPIRL